MEKFSSESYSWPRREGPLPMEEDFDPYGGDLDCQHALKNFGGMTLDEAYSLFVEVPEIYQEDFMFMGPVAFVYYFPVIDRYLREVRSECKFEDCEANILASCIEAQLSNSLLSRSKDFLDQIRSLAEFVVNSISRYSGSKKERVRIKNSWEKFRDI